MSYYLISPSLENYIQSPADDIESFLWVTLYAILKNSDKTVYKDQQSLADMFELGKRGNALLHVQRLIHASREVVVLKGLFNEWCAFTDNLTGRYKDLVEAFSEISAKNGWEDEEEARYWKAAWHGYALEGVCTSLEAIVKHMTN